MKKFIETKINKKYKLTKIKNIFKLKTRHKVMNNGSMKLIIESKMKEKNVIKKVMTIS